MPSKTLSVNNSISSFFQDLAIAAESDNTPDFSISKKGSKITVTVDSTDGHERKIKSHENKTGLQRMISENIQKLPIDERRKLVKHLHVNENLTQSDIAQKTLYSQKTISNDLKSLRDNGEI